MLLGVNLQANYSSNLNTLLNKYPIQIDSVDNFINFIKCGSIFNVDISPNTILCNIHKIDSNKITIKYAIFPDKQAFNNFCINNFQGKVEEPKQKDKRIDYSFCVIGESKEQAVKTKVIATGQDVYMLSLSKNPTLHESESLMLYFEKTINNTDNKKLIKRKN